MKKIICMLLALLACLFITACGAKQPVLSEEDGFCIGEWQTEYDKAFILKADGTAGVWDPGVPAEHQTETNAIEKWVWKQVDVVGTEDGVYHIQIQLYDEKKKPADLLDFYHDPQRFDYMVRNGVTYCTPDDYAAWRGVPAPLPEEAKFCLGEWKRTKQSEPLLTVYDNGLCQIDGEEYYWRNCYIGSNGDPAFWVYKGREEVQSISFRQDPDMGYTVSLCLGGDTYVGLYAAETAPDVGPFEGEWYCNTVERDHEDVEYYQSPVLTFRTDSTCQIAGTEYTWDLSWITDEIYSFDIRDTVGEYAGYLTYYTEGERAGEAYLSCGNDYHDLSHTPTYQTIELTTENWREYFDLCVEGSVENNVFGEAECCSLRQKFLINEPYGGRFKLVNDIALEMTFQKHKYPVEFVWPDGENQEFSYTIGEPVPNENAETEERMESTRINDRVNNRIFGYGYCSTSFDLNTEKATIELIDELEITRIKGTIYVLGN